MESRIETAVERKNSGQYNCAQAVACTYALAAGADESVMMSAGNAFGGGMGCMESTCGALIGAGLVLGMRYPRRADAMKAMRQVLLRFKERNGCTVCRELKGVADGKPVRECSDCVADACEFLEEQLQE